MSETRVGAVERRRDMGVPLGQALEMTLVDDRAVERNRGLGDTVPVERALDGDRPPIAVAARHQSPGVGLDQEGLRIEGVSGARGSLRADRVARAGAKARG